MTAVPPGLIRLVRDRILAGDVTIGPHVWEHGRLDRFGYGQVREVALTGHPIDRMRDRQRILFCGRVRNDDLRWIWLHVVVEYLHPELAGLITAYRPDPAEWEEPPLQRRR